MQKEGGVANTVCGSGAALKPNRLFECAWCNLYWQHGRKKHTDI